MFLLNVKRSLTTNMEVKVGCRRREERKPWFCQRSFSLWMDAAGLSRLRGRWCVYPHPLCCDAAQTWCLPTLVPVWVWSSTLLRGHPLIRLPAWTLQEEHKARLLISQRLAVHQHPQLRSSSFTSSIKQDEYWSAKEDLFISCSIQRSTGTSFGRICEGLTE